MRPITRTFILTAALASSSAAFALSKVTVNVPFNFDSHGKTYLAGKYDVLLDLNADVITLINHSHPEQSAMWIASPADFGPNTAALSMKFDNQADGSHELRSIRIAMRTTPVLDVREKHAAQRAVSISGGR